MKTTLLLFLFLFSCYLVSGNPDKPNNWICYTTAGALNTTGGNIDKDKCGATCSSHSKQWVGYIGAVIAVLGFGSNFIPVKKYNTGDGMFFQWILCIGIWLVGLIVNLIRYQPPFYMPLLFGGVLWTTGNIMVVPIIKMIGMTMGLTLWGVTNLLAGWMTGRFILKQDLSCEGLNYGGIATILISTTILAFVKSEGKVVEDLPPLSEKTPLINSEKSNNSLAGSLTDKLLQGQSITKSNGAHQKITFGSRSTSPLSDDEDLDYSWVDQLGKWPRRIIGFGLSLGIGFLFGFQFIGVEYMRLCNDDTHSCNELDYVFGQFTGILVTSTIWFILYCVWKRNKPKVYPEVILPALASGIIWGIAMVGWFLANQHLSLAVSFPIVTAGPGFVSSSWGILVYREIKGWRNIVLFFVAFTISLSALVMVGLSSCTIHC